MNSTNLSTSISLWSPFPSLTNVDIWWIPLPLPVNEVYERPLCSKLVVVNEGVRPHEGVKNPQNHFNVDDRGPLPLIRLIWKGVSHSSPCRIFEWWNWFLIVWLIWDLEASLAVESCPGSSVKKIVEFKSTNLLTVESYFF